MIKPLTHPRKFTVNDFAKDLHCKFYRQKLVQNLLTEYGYYVHNVNELKFDLVWFHSISTVVDYLIPNTVYTYIINIYDFVDNTFKWARANFFAHS